MIRPARPDDLEYLPDIERAAGEPFREIGMAAVADDDLPIVAELAVFQQARRTWVVTDDADLPVAYVLVDVIDGCAHVEQVSIHPRHARRGLGKQLLDAVEQWARQSGLRAMTMTTFADAHGTRRTTNAWALFHLLTPPMGDDDSRTHPYVGR